MTYHIVFVPTKDLGVATTSAVGLVLADTGNKKRRSSFNKFVHAMRGIHLIDSRQVLFVSDAVNSHGESGLLIVQAGGPEVITDIRQHDV